MSKTADRYLVTGGRPLQGRVRISGAKNAVLPILAATLLCRGECVLHDTPDIRDSTIMLDILRRMGAQAEVISEGEAGRSLRINAESLATFEVREQLTREMRSSIFLMGPVLGRLGKVRISYPGGCAIGPRPIDYHLRGLEALGARIRERYGYLEAEAKELRGAEIYLDFPSVGATENIMMAAVLARGTTIIRNAAREPEIVDLQNFLNSLGGRVRGAGLDVIRIEGVRELSGSEHHIMPDRIEAGTYMVAAAITGGDVEIENVVCEHLESITAKLTEMGVEIRPNGDRVRVKGPARLRSTDLKTLPYPGFPTDMQPQVMAAMTVADSTSIITETIFENRFRQVEELRRLGAQIKVEGRTAVIKGVPRLSGAVVEVPALREGMSLVLAGLAAEGTTTMENIVHIDRGYHNLDGKLRSLGAEIERG